MTYTGAAGQNPPFPPVSHFPPPFPYPFPPLPHNPHVNNISHPPFHAPLFSTAPPTAGFGTFPTHLPPPNSFTLATAPPVAHLATPAQPSPVSPSFRHQILFSNYVDLAQLVHPSSCYPQFPREVLTSHGPVELKQPLTTCSKELTAVKFAFIFSLYCDIICSTFPDRRSELDVYMSLNLDEALQFGGHGFYTYHILFASQAAGHLQQFNQGTYSGTQDPELYFRVFAARPSINCDSCGHHPTQLQHAPSPLPCLAPPQPKTN